MHSQNTLAVRNWANQVMCPDCYAAPGDTCFRKDANGKRVELAGPPAHPKRIERAHKLRELPFDGGDAA